MPSASHQIWTTTTAGALDEVAQAHAAIRGRAAGRRAATQQINRGYALLLASHFQGFCRDLHTECVSFFLGALKLGPEVSSVLRGEMLRGRQLDRGNAQPSSLGADFGRFDIRFWDEVEAHQPRNRARRAALEDLNTWRNAIAHHDFDPARLGGTVLLRLAQVRRWRAACDGLARSFDEVMRVQLEVLTKRFPW